ncbi:Glycosyl transferase family 11 [Bacteroidales bacterium KHT7]|nr:Glycosyl transferase family 11 [Bacteroidales bacterium KHT7]
MENNILQTTLLGRLGNQLFIYAATRVMALESGKKLKLTCDAMERFRATYRLDCFNIPQDQVSLVSDKHLSIKQKIGYFFYLLKCRHKTVVQIHELENKYQKFYHRFGLILNQEGYIKPLLLEGGNWYALGYFQSDKYFTKYEDLIRKELTFKTDMFCKDSKMLGSKLRANKNSVCLHIRRGDYLNDPVFAVCDINYYNKAIDKLLELIPNAEFFVFSDSIDEVREFLAKYCDNYFHYIDVKYTDQESLYLGSCCNNFIMTNSTFSWWMQYLSDNPNKIVLAPNRWYNTNNPCDIYQDNWMIIEV